MSRDRWERFCNWLEAKPWRWRYDRIWRGIQGDPSLLRRLWWTVTFPHAHHDDEEAAERLMDAEIALAALAEFGDGIDRSLVAARMRERAREALAALRGE